VSHNGETIEAQRAHYLNLVKRHRPFRVVRMVLTIGRLAAVAVAAQVGQDNRVVLRNAKPDFCTLHAAGGRGTSAPYESFRSYRTKNADSNPDRDAR
jgi:hypothetical protein